MLTETLRETGKGETTRPTPQGEFDGVTRASAMAALLDKHKESLQPKEPFLHRFARALQLGMVAGIIWVGPKLTPQEAADVLRPNQTRFPAPCERCDGPYVFVLDSSTGSGPYGPLELRGGSYAQQFGRGRIFSGRWSNTVQFAPLGSTHESPRRSHVVSEGYRPR